MEHCDGILQPLSMWTSVAAGSIAYSNPGNTFKRVDSVSHDPQYRRGRYGWWISRRRIWCRCRYKRRCKGRGWGRRMSWRRRRQHCSHTLRRKGYPYNTHEYNYYCQDDERCLHTFLHIHVSKITSAGQSTVPSQKPRYRFYANKLIYLYKIR